MYGALKNYTMAASNWYERLKSLKEKLPKETKRQPDILLADRDHFILGKS